MARSPSSVCAIVPGYIASCAALLILRRDRNSFVNACDCDLLSLYLDGALTLPARMGLEAHLGGCSECQSELIALRRIDRVLSGFGEREMVPVPRQTHLRITTSVERKRRLGRIGKLGTMMPAAFGSSIAALLVLASVHAGTPYHASAPASVVPNTSSVALRSISKQSAALIRLHRASAVLPADPTPPPPLAALPHRPVGVN